MTEANAKEAARRAYDQIARQFGAGYGGEGKHGTWVVAMLSQLEPGGAVLDLGCGSGVPVARDLADAVYRTWLKQAGLVVEPEECIRDGNIGHVLFSARRA